MSQLIDKISSIIKNRYYQTVVYKRYSKFAIESQYWSKDKWLDWQWMQIKELLEYAYQWVPYYSNLFKDIGLTPQDIISWDRFREIPILSKKIVRQNEKQLLTTHPGERKKAIAFSSSGSTGLPLRFYTNREQQIVTSAFMDFQWSRIGYTRNSSRVVIRGLYSPKLISKMSPRDWNISVCGLSDENLPEITSFLNKTKPDYLHAFPSSLWTLTNLMNKHSITLNYKPKGLLIGSEKYPNEYRTLFEGFYECKSYSWLGLAEGTILAGECENTDDLHVIPAYSYVELEKNSESKEILNGDMIIGTSLHNRAFPFIRYYCGDLAIPVESDCVCGRGYQIIKNVVGRDSDYFIAFDGSEISLTALYSAIHGNIFHGITECQFVQNEPGKVDVIIVKEKNYTEKDGQHFVLELNKRSDNRLHFTIIARDELIKTTTGKVKLLIKEM